MSPRYGVRLSLPRTTSYAGSAAANACASSISAATSLPQHRARAGRRSSRRPSPRPWTCVRRRSRRPRRDPSAGLRSLVRLVARTRRGARTAPALRPRETASGYCCAPSPASRASRRAPSPAMDEAPSARRAASPGPRAQSSGARLGRTVMATTLRQARSRTTGSAPSVRSESATAGSATGVCVLEPGPDRPAVRHIFAVIPADRCGLLRMTSPTAASRSCCQPLPRTSAVRCGAGATGLGPTMRTQA